MLLILSAIAGGQTLAPPNRSGSQMDDHVGTAVKQIGTAVKQTGAAVEQIGALVTAFRGQMGVAAIDLGTGETIAVNADARFPTASTIKTAVMIEAWQQAADGRLSMDTTLTLRDVDKVGGAGVLRGLHGPQGGLALTVADLIHLMIVLSDNTATNLLIGRVGTARVNERLESYGLGSTRLFRPTFRDGRADVLPELEREFGLGMTTPREMARLMALIAEGKAVNRSASDAMLATLRGQQDRAMIPRLIAAADRIQIGNKTGTDEEKHALEDGVKRHVRADAAIVTGPGFSYVIAIYARQVEDTRWGVDNDALTTGARISKMVYEHFTRKQGVRP
jgi:beta-lactamase class A